LGSGPTSPGSGTPRSLFEHWNGKKWKIEPGPPTLESSDNAATNELLGIGKVNSKTLWAVGNQTSRRTAASKRSQRKPRTANDAKAGMNKV
jgi:hypothetical protein